MFILFVCIFFYKISQIIVDTIIVTESAINIYMCACDGSIQLKSKIQVKMICVNFHFFVFFSCSLDLCRKRKWSKFSSYQNFVKTVSFAPYKIHWEFPSDNAACAKKRAKHNYYVWAFKLNAVNVINMIRSVVLSKVYLFMSSGLEMMSIVYRARIYHMWSHSVQTI